MGTLFFNFHGLPPSSSSFHSFNYITKSKNQNTLKLFKPPQSFSRRGRVKAISTVPGSGSESKQAEKEEQEQEPPTVSFAFVSSVLLPDGTPDLHYRTASGGQTLRRVMVDSNIDLYGPYARPLLNCAGAGTCGTCMVEIIAGKELLNPRTDKEKEKLKRKPKNWRLACQTTVGKSDSRGLLVVQQLPEWKAHEWNYEKVDPSEFLQSS